MREGIAGAMVVLGVLGTVVSGMVAGVYRPLAVLILFGIAFGFVVFPLVVWVVIWAFS